MKPAELKEWNITYRTRLNELAPHGNDNVDVELKEAKEYLEAADSTK